MNDYIGKIMIDATGNEEMGIVIEYLPDDDTKKNIYKKPGLLCRWISFGGESSEYIIFVDEIVKQEDNTIFWKYR